MSQIDRLDRFDRLTHNTQVRNSIYIEDRIYLYMVVSTYQPYLSDHTLPKSLRQRIRELILAQAATKEIVDQLRHPRSMCTKRGEN